MTEGTTVQVYRHPLLFEASQMYVGSLATRAESHENRAMNTQAIKLRHDHVSNLSDIRHDIDDSPSNDLSDSPEDRHQSQEILMASRQELEE